MARELWQGGCCEGAPSGLLQAARRPARDKLSPVHHGHLVCFSNSVRLAPAVVQEHSKEPRLLLLVYTL